MHDKLLRLVRIERKVTSRILDLLPRVKYLELGYSNLYDYLVRGLGYSEGVAYQRLSAIRIIKDVPEVKEKIERGVLSFSSLAKASAHLRKKTLVQKKELLVRLENKSAREVEKLLSSGESTLLSKKRYVNSQTIRITMDVSEDEYQEIQKLRALKSQKNDKDLFIKLVKDKLKTYNNTKHKPTASENPRQVTQTLKNYLLKKASYRCQYPGCTQNHYLQIDHIKPVRHGGRQNPENLQVLCASHNMYKG
jgi:hypothetical protein